MTKPTGVLIALTAAALVLTGCGGEDEARESSAATSSAPATSATGPEVPGALPVSRLAPGLKLPAGSVEDDPTEYPELELWRVPTSKDATLRDLEPQLPISQSYDGLTYCTTDRNGKLGTTQWSWGGSGQDTLAINVSKGDGTATTVTINRGLDESDDRADCDVPAPGGAPQRSALAGIDLPAGSSVVEPLKPDPTMEQWALPGSHQEVVQYLRGKLPIGFGSDGMAWCNEDGDGEYVDWVWGDKTDLLDVHVLGNQVTITRSPSDYGCIR